MASYVHNPAMNSTRRITPRYETLANELQQQIETGVYPIGAQFPTEYEICAEHHVSRHTVRAALARLHSLGLILRRPGAGTRVTAPKPPMRYQQEVNAIEDLLQYGRSSPLEWILSERLVPPAEIANALGVRPGTELIRVYCLRFGEPRSLPICTTDFYLRPRRGLPSKTLLAADTAIGAVLRLLDLRQMGDVDQTFDAISLPAAQAQLLGVDPESAALRAVRVYHSAEGDPVACVISTHPSGRFAYSMRLARRTSA
jgi:GntR family transcriptional regulator